MDNPNGYDYNADRYFGEFGDADEVVTDEQVAGFWQALSEVEPT